MAITAVTGPAGRQVRLRIWLQKGARFNGLLEFGVDPNDALDLAICSWAGANLGGAQDVMERLSFYRSSECEDAEPGNIGLSYPAMDNRVKIEVAELQLGMYVVELDRPWLDSPFLFQGFPLNDSDEIEKVRQLCKFVYVDEEQSTVPIPGSERAAGNAATAQKNAQKQAHRDDYQRPVEEELPAANQIRTRAEAAVTELKSVREPKPRSQNSSMRRGLERHSMSRKQKR